MTQAFISAVAVASAAHHAIEENERKRITVRFLELDKLMKPRIVGFWCWKKRVEVRTEAEAIQIYSKRDRGTYGFATIEYWTENHFWEKRSKINNYLVTALASIDKGDGMVLADSELCAMVELHRDKIPDFSVKVINV